MQLAGFDVTRQIIAHIEAGNCAVTDTQMPYFVKVFRIGIEELFPVELRCGERMGDLEKLCPPKPPRKSRVE